ncbi:hypothetical protein LOK49_LG01G01803 [Camellia lanceoleosa]|uniref:Uncharacterized protein n=1 Tax=Camellia lanceoleosa TaxID=1840588 RepID=A0ACC0J3R4_9ERIC|nr:hypothetical protein LOK49_LG01G01803 [Camellia lanceoleosa]
MTMIIILQGELCKVLHRQSCISHSFPLLVSLHSVTLNRRCVLLRSSARFLFQSSGSSKIRFPFGDGWEGVALVIEGFTKKDGWVSKTGDVTGLGLMKGLVVMYRVASKVGVVAGFTVDDGKEVRVVADEGWFELLDKALVGTVGSSEIKVLGFRYDGVGRSVVEDVEEGGDQTNRGPRISLHVLFMTSD